MSNDIFKKSGDTREPRPVVMDDSRLRPTLDFDKSLNAFYFLWTGPGLAWPAWCDEKLDKIRFTPPPPPRVENNQTIPDGLCWVLSQPAPHKQQLQNRAEISTWNRRAFSVGNTEQLCRYQATVSLPLHTILLSFSSSQLICLDWQFGGFVMLEVG